MGGISPSQTIHCNLLLILQWFCIFCKEISVLATRLINSGFITATSTTETLEILCTGECGILRAQRKLNLNFIALCSHNGLPFSTFDVDNDSRDSGDFDQRSCARLYKVISRGYSDSVLFFRRFFVILKQILAEILS